MFVLAVFVGIYSYLIFSLGILNLLTKWNVFLVTVIWTAIYLFYQRKFLLSILSNITNRRFNIRNHKKLFLFLLVVIATQAIVNFIGALGPELAFDALWYHLTLPQLYLLNHKIYHIPGGLLYYSDMPKLGEMLYVGALSFGNEIEAKLIHFIFSIVVSIVLYIFSRKFFNQSISLLIVVIFYSNLVVDWESITAYIDLIRAFFELLAVWAFINWYKTDKHKWLVVKGVMMGFAIATKLLAFGSFLILLLILLIASLSKKNKVTSIIKNLAIYAFSTLLIPLPWFIFAFLNTGNPVYPFFTPIYEVTSNSPSPDRIVQDLWNLFMYSSDPISPVYLLFLPLIFIFYKQMRKEIKLLIWYSGLSLLLWYFTPRTGGGRFILPYLPAFSFVCGAIYSEILKKTRIEWRFISKLMLGCIIFVSVISIGYRALANEKYLPVIFGRETKQSFLANNLNFHYGDFADIDGFFAHHIAPSDTVLLYGFHNLFYMDFHYIDNTWAKKGDTFDYIATQNTKLPSRFANWRLIYSNDKTMVKLFRPPAGGCSESCYY